MSQTARVHETAEQPAPAEQTRPALEVVRDEAGRDETGADAGPVVTEPNFGRGAVIGALLGFSIAATGVTVAGTVGGLGFAPALGLGVFVGTWGGMGFGSMMGATIPVSRHHERHRHAR